MDWLQSFDPSAELIVASYRNHFSDLSLFDGVVLTGGEDVDPAFSKASPLELVEQVDQKRDEFEFQMIEKAMKLHMPLFGICRGLQVINVFFGGTLIADLPSAGFALHSAQKNEPPLRHVVNISAGSLIGSVTGVTHGEINSYHHQAVLTAADELVASGFSDDRVIESLEWKQKAGKPFLLAVQWHPERMHEPANPMTRAIGSAFFMETKKFNSLR